MGTGSAANLHHSHLDAPDAEAGRGQQGAEHLVLEPAVVALDDAAHDVADAHGSVAPIVRLQAHLLDAAVQVLGRGRV